jgi:NitT/TauT family transport system ATP-binding protein
MEAPGEGHAEGGQPLLADAVSCRGVSKAYLSRAKQSSPFVALSDVDLMVADGEFVTILGPSGCGKSTLLNIMAGIDQPTRGSVTFSDRIRRKAYLFQRDTLLPWRSALRNVEIGLTALKIPQAERRQRAMNWLRQVGLEGFEHSYPSQLSGGMRRRVALATVFAHGPDVLFMDEPFGAVDAQTREDLEDLLLRVRAERNITTLLVTHDIDESVYTGDRVIVLTPGPGRVQAEVPVDLPAPRDQIATKELREFARLRAEVSRLVRGTRVPPPQRPQAGLMTTTNPAWPAT